MLDAYVPFVRELSSGLLLMSLHRTDTVASWLASAQRMWALP
jgi:hypothetical protein